MHSLHPKDWLSILSFGLALAVPGVALALGDAPFGWTRLLVVHLLAAWPLSLLAAEAIGDRTPQGSARTWVWLILGTCLAAGTLAVGPEVRTVLDQRQAGWEARVVVRTLWCLLLQVPWCLLGLELRQGMPARPGQPERRPALFPEVPRFVALIVLILPGAYTVALIDQQSKKAEELLQGGRLMRAQRLVEGLCDLGSRTPLAGQPPQAVRKEVGRMLESSRAVAQHPLPTWAPAAARVERAQCLAVLDRLEEARRELEPIADAEPQATLLLAAVLQGGERWEESSRWYRRALELLEAASASEATVAGRVRAYDGLAFNARGRKAFREAEAVYHEALERVPEAQAHFHFQLGRHHHQGGRPGLARQHLETAARLDPARYAEPARPMLEDMALRTPSCLLR